MPIQHSALLCALICCPLLAAAQQTPVAPQPATTSAPASATPPVATTDPAPPAMAQLSEVVQPSLATMQSTLNGLRIDKWKGGSVRNEAAGNINSIQKDLQETLPGLLADADAAPGSMTKLLPVSRNLGALYDVVMRVWDGARIAAPGEQVNQLQQAMAGVDKARHTVDDRLLVMAAGSEKLVGDLQISLAKVAAVPVCPVVAPPPPPAPAPKKKVVKKRPTATKTVTPATSTGSGSTTAAPQAKPQPQQ